MPKPITLLLILILASSCNSKSELIVSRDDLRNKTFNLVLGKDFDTLTIDFKDSTHRIIEYNRVELPWNIKKHKQLTFLVLDNRVIAIEKEDSITFNCIFIGLNESTFKMIKRNTALDRKLIYGNWIQSNYLGRKKDSNSTVSSPPLPPNLKEEDLIFPPYFTITKDSILYYSFDRINKSQIEMNNTSEYITMDLSNLPHNGRDRLWKIKIPNDSTLITNRKRGFDGNIESIIDTLYRKR